MPRGGARPGSGAKRRTRYIAKIKATPEELNRVSEASRRGPEARRLKDQLAEYAHLVATFALQYQPQRNAQGVALRDAQGRPVWPDADYQRFKELMQLHGYLASKGAPFQDPTYKSIMVAPVLPENGDMKVVEDHRMTIFDAMGKIVADEILDEKDDK